MTTRKQLNQLENFVNFSYIDYSKLSDNQLIRLHELGLKVENDDISFQEEIEIERILGSAASGN